MVQELSPRIQVPVDSSSLPPFADATDPHWAKYHEQCNEFAWLVGHEVSDKLKAKPNFGKALNLLADIQPFGADGASRVGLAHTMGVLGAYGTRFDDNQNLKTIYGENSATHSVMAVLLSNYVLNRATPVGAPENAALKQFRQDSALSLLLHDAGEAFGEFSTKSEQVANPALREDKQSLRKYEAEYLVLRYVLTQSMRVASGEISADDLARDIAHKRELLGFNATPREGLEKRMDAFRQELNVDAVPLSPELTAERNRFMNFWIATEISPHLEAAKAISTSDKPYHNELQQRLAEFQKLSDKAQSELQQQGSHFTKEYSTFLGRYVKMIDDLQGVRHYNRFLKAGQSISEQIVSEHPKLAPKTVILNREDPAFYLGMIEKNLPSLHTASQVFDWAKPIATWTTGLSYECAADSASLMQPPEFPLTQYKHQIPEKTLTGSSAADKQDRDRSANLQMRAEQGWWSAVYRHARNAALAGNVMPTEQFIATRVQAYLADKPKDASYTLPDEASKATLGFSLPAFPEVLGKAKIL